MKLNMLFFIFISATVLGFHNNERTLLDYGAQASGLEKDATLNSASLARALAKEKTLYIPKGVYVIKLNRSFIPMQGASIVGANYGQQGSGSLRTILRFVTDNKNYKQIFRIIKDNITFRNIHIQLRGPQADSTQFFFMGGNNFTLIRSRLDGGNKKDHSNLVNAFHFLDRHTRNFRLESNFIHNFNRVILRPNAASGIIREVDIIHNRIEYLRQGGIQFNTPTVPARSIRIISNKFHHFHGNGSEKIFIGLASAKSVQIYHNEFTGDAKNCIHLEEDSDSVFIRWNKCLASSIGVFLTSNNVWCTEHNIKMRKVGRPQLSCHKSWNWRQPNNVYIWDNTFIDGSKRREYDGIQATRTPSPITAFSNLEIRRNTISGYKRSINLDNDFYIIRNNTLKNSDICLRFMAEENRHNISGNSATNCKRYIFSIFPDIAPVIKKNTYN